MINRLSLLLLLFTALGSLLFAGETIKDYEYGVIDSLLNRAGLETSSLNFVKDWSLSTEFKISQVVEIINNPLEFPRFVDSLKSVIDEESISEIADFLSAVVFSFDDFRISDIQTENIGNDRFETYFEKNVKKARDLLDYGEFLFRSVEKHRSGAFRNLTAQDKEILTWLSYRMWSDVGDQERYAEEFAFLPNEDFEELTMEELKQTIDKIDWSEFVRANMVFSKGLETLLKNLETIDFANRRPIIRNTEWGKFVIGTKGDDVYHDRIAFIIEPGGNDLYLCELSADFQQPYYLAIDLGGNDLWQNRKTGGLNRVLGGIGWSVSMAGEDYYQGGDLAFSSFFGFQYHHNRGENTVYRTGRYTLGAATFGLSVNVNDGGNNIYHTTGYSHGFGGTLGAGLLIDKGGDDLYYAGGKYLHKPLRPDDYRSMAQGFGFGVRPDWGGGIGLLYDKSGNDSYEGGVYAQGVGYWYALGILLDGGGNDTFNAVQYAQGSGIHLAGGFLYNESGDDTYYSRFGPGQGAGHDYAVGFLIDRAGDDHYSIDGGNGLGLTNSVGIFLDVAGNDRYERNKLTNYGYANEARDSGGIGLFIDLGGDDIYPDSLWTNNNFWVRGTYGIGLDIEYSPPHAPESEEELQDEPDEDLSYIDNLTCVEELFRIAAEWEVGSSVQRVRRARSRILQFEEEAARHIFEQKLATKSGLEYRAVLNFAQNSELFRESLGQGLSVEDSLAVKNAISLIGDLELDEYVDKLAQFLTEKKYLPSVIGTLGEFKTDSVVELIKPFSESPSEHLRFITARSLKRINTPLSREYLKKMKDDSSFLVRTAVKLAFRESEE